jgi:hypothetical protein
VQAPDSGPALPCQPTSSKHPYRPLAAFQRRLSVTPRALALVAPLSYRSPPAAAAVVAAFAVVVAAARRRHAAAALLSLLSLLMGSNRG